jgi:tetratricopeptide (TPR) repeat protein
MSVAPDDDNLNPPANSGPPRARQWSKGALAMAILFASLPLAGKLFLDSWRFDGALELACLCLVAAAYLYLMGRESQAQVPDSAAVLDEALRLAAAGQPGDAIALLDEAIRLNPRLWQAWQYRGQMRLEEPADAESALRDFNRAIRLAPREAHLYLLRSRAYTLLGRDAPARADLETAARLGSDAGEPVGPSMA